MYTNFPFHYPKNNSVLKPHDLDDRPHAFKYFFQPFIFLLLNLFTAIGEYSRQRK